MKQAEEYSWRIRNRKRKRRNLTQTFIFPGSSSLNWLTKSFLGEFPWMTIISNLFFFPLGKWSQLTIICHNKFPPLIVIKALRLPLFHKNFLSIMTFIFHLALGLSFSLYNHCFAYRKNSSIFVSGMENWNYFRCFEARLVMWCKQFRICELSHRESDNLISKIILGFPSLNQNRRNFIKTNSNNFIF